MSQPTNTLHWTGPVLITADEQKGKRQYQNDERKQDYAYIWQWLCTQLQEKYGCMLVAGDFFDSPKPSSGDYHSSAEQAAATGKPVGIIDGNHDGDERSWFDAKDSAFTYLEDKRVEINGCQIHCLNYRSREDLLLKLKEIKETYEHTDVIVGHQMFQELSPTIDIAGVGAIGQFGAKDLLNLGFENLTVFLGDLHTSSDWRDEKNNLEVVYPGSPEMTEKGEGRHKSARQGNWEDQKFYALHWEPAPGFPQNWTRVQTDHRPWRKYQVDGIKPTWEEELTAIIPEVLTITETDHLHRKPIVHLTLTVTNFLAIEGTYWETFIAAIRPLCCVFDFDIKELQAVLPTQTTRDEEMSVRDTPDKGIELLTTLLREATAEAPNQELILKFCETAMRKSKETLNQEVSTEIKKL